MNRKITKTHIFQIFTDWPRYHAHSAQIFAPVISSMVLEPYFLTFLLTLDFPRMFSPKQGHLARLAPPPGTAAPPCWGQQAPQIWKNSPHPRRGSRACWDKGTILQILHLPGHQALPPTPPQMLTPRVRKSSKFQTLKKDAFSSKTDLLWDPTGEPKSAISLKNGSPERPLDPFQKLCQNMLLFRLSQTLENQAPARAGAQFSLCGPTPKKSSKWCPKTSLLGSP